MAAPLAILMDTCLLKSDNARISISCIICQKPAFSFLIMAKHATSLPEKDNGREFPSFPPYLPTRRATYSPVMSFDTPRLHKSHFLSSRIRQPLSSYLYMILVSQTLPDTDSPVLLLCLGLHHISSVIRTLIHSRQIPPVLTGSFTGIAFRCPYTTSSISETATAFDHHWYRYVRCQPQYRAKPPLHGIRYPLFRTDCLYRRTVSR